MFEIGILIGIYAYTIFGLGLLGFLYVPIIILFTVTFIGTIIFYHRRSIRGIGERVKKNIGYLAQDRFSLLLFFILIIQAFINFIGVLGPELGFDALWYHMTIPKLYLIHHTITYVPGGLLFYSAMPKLLELLYTGGLAVSPIFPKVIHFGFGILTLVVLYKISRKFLTKNLSLLVLVIFYANLVVGWESISAYIDLGRTFFELLSFSALFHWIKKQERKYFYYSAIFLGLAITTKLLSLGSLILFVGLIGIMLYRKKETLAKISTAIGVYVGVAMLIPLPWLVFSYMHTGNALYPFFSNIYPVPFPIQLFNPVYFFHSFLNLLLFSPDPLNPLYLMVLPLFVIFFKKWSFSLRLIFLFVMGGFVIWYITPQTGGGRFILPYMPLLSLLSVVSIVSVSQKRLQKFLICIALGIASISLGYRAIANEKFIPFILGRESEATFLRQHLNFSYGDFYDIDGYFTRHIKPTDTVLLYGFHNLYYVDFPFIDATWVKKGDVFTYIAVQNGSLPKRFHTWELVYVNKTTHVGLYSIGGITWTY